VTAYRRAAPADAPLSVRLRDVSSPARSRVRDRLSDAALELDDRADIQAEAKAPAEPIP